MHWVCYSAQKMLYSISLYSLLFIAKKSRMCRTMVTQMVTAMVTAMVTEMVTAMVTVIITISAPLNERLRTSQAITHDNYIMTKKQCRMLQTNRDYISSLYLKPFISLCIYSHHVKKPSMHVDSTQNTQ